MFGKNFPLFARFKLTSVFMLCMLSYLRFGKKPKDFDVYFEMILNTSYSLIIQIDDKVNTLKDNRNSSNLPNLTTITKQI